MKSYGLPSKRVINSLHLLIMVLRCPQANMAAKKPIISTSCFSVKRWGMTIGSCVIKVGWLYSSTFLSKKVLISKSAIIFYDCKDIYFIDTYHIYNTFVQNFSIWIPTRPKRHFIREACIKQVTIFPNWFAPI